MLKVELNNRNSDGDPEPCFATSSEIEIAERLRHQLEKRLLAPFTTPPASRALNDVPEEAAPLGNGHQHERKPL